MSSLARPIEASESSYRVAWLIGIAIATLSTPFVVVFKATAPWIILIPITIGAFLVTVLEFRLLKLPKPLKRFLYAEPNAEEAPTDFQMLRKYDELMALDIKPPKRKIPKEQLAFKGFPEAKPSNSVRYLSDEEGRKVAVISCEKFSALMITYLVEHVDESTDVALRNGLDKFSKSESVKREIEMFLQDKTVREVVKAQFRGNMAMTIAKGGQKVVKDLAKVMEEDAKGTVEAPEFRLEYAAPPKV